MRPPLEWVSLRCRCEASYIAGLLKEKPSGVEWNEATSGVLFLVLKEVEWNETSLVHLSVASVKPEKWKGVRPATQCWP